MAGTRSSTKGKQKDDVKNKESERARGRNWQDDETTLLIEKIQNNFDKFRGRGTKPGTFEKIAKALKDEGVKRTADGCQNKYKLILSQYRKAVMHNNGTGQSPSNFKYFDRMHSFMSSTPLINATPRESLGRFEESNECLGESNESLGESNESLEESNEGLEGDGPIPSTSYSMAIGSLNRGPPQETVNIESDIEATDASDCESLSEDETQQRVSVSPDILGEQNEFNELSKQEEEAQTKRNGKCKSTTNFQKTKSSKKKLNAIDSLVEELKEERLMSADLQRKISSSMDDYKPVLRSIESTMSLMPVLMTQLIQSQQYSMYQFPPTPMFMANQASIPAAVRPPRFPSTNANDSPT